MGASPVSSVSRASSRKLMPASWAARITATPASWEIRSYVRHEPNDSSLTSRSEVPRRRRSRVLTSSVPAVVLRHLVDADCGAQQQHLVLAGGDRHAVHVADREPPFRDRRDDLSSGRDLELVVQDVALRFEHTIAGDLDREALAQDVKEGAFDLGHDLAAALDVHRLAQGEHLPLHPRQLVAVDVLQGEGLREHEDLAVHLEDVLAAVVLHPEVFADREDL